MTLQRTALQRLTTPALGTPFNYAGVAEWLGSGPEHVKVVRQFLMRI